MYRFAFSERVCARADILDFRYVCAIPARKPWIGTCIERGSCQTLLKVAVDPRTS